MVPLSIGLALVAGAAGAASVTLPMPAAAAPAAAAVTGMLDAGVLVLAAPFVLFECALGIMPVITAIPTALNSVTAPAATIIMGCILRACATAPVRTVWATSRGASSMLGMLNSLVRFDLKYGCCNALNALCCTALTTVQQVGRYSTGKLSKSVRKQWRQTRILSAIGATYAACRLQPTL
jgi:hypothetical protein